MPDFIEPVYGKNKKKVTPSEAVLGPALQAAKETDLYKEPVYRKKDAEATPEPELPFAEGSTLKVGPMDTGLPIGPTTARVLAGSGKRINDLGLRYDQLMRNPGAQEAIDEMRVRDQPLMDTTAANVGYALPDMIALGGATGPVKGALSRIPGAAGVNLSNMTPSAVMGGLQGLTNPTTSEDAEKENILNATMGVAGGVVGNAVGRGLGSLGGRAVSASPALIPDIARRYAASKGVQLPRANWSDPEAQMVNDLMKSKGIGATIGDLDRNSTWRGAEDLFADAPMVGRKADMAKQKQAVIADIEKTRDTLGGQLTGTEGAEINESVNRAYQAKKAASGLNFKRVANIAENDPGIGKIKPNELYSEVEKLARKKPGLFEAFKSHDLTRKVFNLAEDSGPQSGLIFNPKTGQPFKFDQELTFEASQELRQILGGELTKLTDALKAGSQHLPKGVFPKDVAAFGKLFGAFERDLDNWGMNSSNKQLRETWKDAMAFHKKEVVPYTNPMDLPSKSSLIRDIKNGAVDVETIPDKAVQAKRTSLAQDMMDLTDAPGKEAMKRVLINKITDPALNADLQSGLSTAQLLKMTKRHDHPTEAVFSPTERQMLSNTHDISHAADRASLSGGSGVKTGSRAIPWLMGGAVTGLSIPAYHALSAYDPEMSSGSRMAAAAAVPLAVLAGARGANMYTRSGLGKNLHFAEPTLRGPVGALQRYGAGAIRGAGEPLEDEYRHYRLGNRR